MSILSQIGNDFGAVWNGIKSIFSGGSADFISQSLAILDRNSGTLLLQIAQDVNNEKPDDKFGDLVEEILTQAKAAGAVTIAEEETLAAQTALQFVKNVAALFTNATATGAASAETETSSQTQNSTGATDAATSSGETETPNEPAAATLPTGSAAGVSTETPGAADGETKTEGEAA